GAARRRVCGGAAVPAAQFGRGAVADKGEPGCVSTGRKKRRKSRQGAKTPRAPRKRKKRGERKQRVLDTAALSLPMLLCLLCVLASWRLCLLPPGAHATGLAFPVSSNADRISSLLNPRSRTMDMPVSLLCRSAIIVLLLAAPAFAEGPLAFHLTFDKKAHARPFTGRVYVMLFKAKAPALRSGPNWLRPEPFFALDVKNWKPG